MEYKTNIVEAGVKFLKNKNVSFDLEIDDDICEYGSGDIEQENRHTCRIDVDVKDRIWTDGTSIWATENRDVEDYKDKTKGSVKGVKVSGLHLLVSKDYNEEDAYWSGGLTGYAYYDGSGKDGTWFDGKDEDNGIMINRWTGKKSDGLIYTDDGFVKNLEKYLEDKCDFDSKLLSDYLDFSYSEQGMQDEEAVNFDVEMDGDFWKLCAKKLREDELKEGAEYKHLGNNIHG